MTNNISEIEQAFIYAKLMTEAGGKVLHWKEDFSDFIPDDFGRAWLNEYIANEEVQVQIIKPKKSVIKRLANAKSKAKY